MDLPDFANLKPVGAATAQPDVSMLKPGVFQPAKSLSPFNPKSPNSQFVDPNGKQSGIGFGGVMSAIGQGIKQTVQDQIDPLVSGAKEVASDTSQAFSSGVDQIKQGASEFGNNGDIVGPSLKIGAGVVNTAFSPLAAPLKPVSKTIEFGANKIADIKGVQNFANSKAGNITSEALEPIANAGTIAQGALAAYEAPKMIEKGNNLVNSVGEKAKPGVLNVANKVATGANKVLDTAQKIDVRLGGEAATKTATKIAQENAVKAPKVAGQIVQGEVADIPKAQRALSQVDVSKVKTYQDLATQLDDKIKKVTALQDKAYDTRPNPIHIDDLTYQGHNFVNDALNQLGEFYKKTNDIQGQREINTLQTKANTQGLTLKEVNQLARDHGDTLNAYNANGELASGLTKQAAENTRIGLKNTARNFMDSKALSGSDFQLSDLINTKNLVSDVVEKVNDLSQKIQQRGIGEKIGKLAGTVLNTMTGGSIKGLIEHFIGRGTGLKTLNALDLQEMLQSSLKDLQSLNDPSISNADFTSKLNEIIKKGNPQKLLPAPEEGAPKVKNNIPIEQPSKVITNSADEASQSINRIGGKGSRRTAPLEEGQISKPAIKRGSYNNLKNYKSRQLQRIIKESQK